MPWVGGHRLPLSLSLAIDAAGVRANRRLADPDTIPRSGHRWSLMRACWCARPERAAVCLLMVAAAATLAIRPWRHRRHGRGIQRCA